MVVVVVVVGVVVSVELVQAVNYSSTPNVVMVASKKRVKAAINYSIVSRVHCSSVQKLC